MIEEGSGSLPKQIDLNIDLQGYGDQPFFIDDPKRYPAIMGGIRSGKTHSGTQKGFKKCCENPGKDGLVTAPDYNRITGATLPKYLSVFPREFIKKVNFSTHEIDTVLDNHIWFRSTTDPQTLRAYEVAWAHMDEGAYSPYEAFQVLQGRISQIEDSQLWITTTPNIDNPLNWVWAEFGNIAPDDTERSIYFLDTLENPFLSEKYKEDLRRQYSNDMQLIELKGMFVPMSGNSFFDVEVLRRMLEEDVREPREEEKGTRIYHKPGIGKRYVAGMDIAEGRQAGDNASGGTGNPDFQCLRISDYATGEDVAQIHTRVPLDEFFVEAQALLARYNNAYCGVEINYDKKAAEKLIELGHPRSRMYHFREGESGWLTNKTTRSPMLREYEEAIRSRSSTIHDKECLMEHFSFIKDKTGRPGAAHNSHDDYVIAGAIMWQMRSHAIFGDKAPVREVVYF